MKKLIKKWLGIDIIERQNREIENGLVAIMEKQIFDAYGNIKNEGRLATEEEIKKFKENLKKGDYPWRQK